MFVKEAKSGVVLYGITKYSRAFFRKHFTECGAIAKLFIPIIWHGGLSIIVIMMDLRLLLDPKLP